uniref:Uncharacterized protein n=1 Tax=Bracon brevicornis TaxID=1563983 RepID=A0A6V7LCI9_9HYME
MIEKLNVHDHFPVSDEGAITPFIRSSSQNSTPDVLGNRNAIRDGLWHDNKAAGISKTLKKLRVEFCSIPQGPNESVTAFATCVEDIAMSMAKIRLRVGLRQLIRRYLKILECRTFSDYREMTQNPEEAISCSSERAMARDTGQNTRGRHLDDSSGRRTGISQDRC